MDTREPLYTADGEVTFVEIIMQVPQKTGKRNIIGLSNTTPGHFPKAGQGDGWGVHGMWEVGMCSAYRTSYKNCSSTTPCTMNIHNGFLTFKRMTIQGQNDQD